MLDRLARRLYERLGSHYELAALATQIPAAVLIALGIVGVLASYYHPSVSDVIVIAATTCAFTIAGVGRALLRQRVELEEIATWAAEGVHTDAETTAAWQAATNFPMRSFRRNSVTTNAIAAVPSVAVIVIVLGLPPGAYPVILAAGAIAAAYGTVLTYSIAEFLVRPAIEDIARALPDSFQFTRSGVHLRKRLVISLPVFTAITGLVVAAIVSDGGGTRMLAISVAASLAVGLALSFELTVLLSRAITDPIVHLRDALARVREGDYQVRVPVLSGDELGDLSDAFNRMAQGLAERERMREAFGTYLDKDVAGFILSGQFPEEGVEVDVSIMFCDVPGFTPFAESASASEIVASLNAFFELIVPVIFRHGGHVDKFLGDGLLAVFGAPEGYPDHADRALAAGLEVIDAVEASAIPLGARIGINTGRVVAGSIGGAGRLNFSVIGDPVNVAARVEQATRETGDELLLTRATRDALVRPAVLRSRGWVSLKGKSDPIEVFAPARQAETVAKAADAAVGALPGEEASAPLRARRSALRP